MRILLDFVDNHSSSIHPFFKDASNNPASKYSDWYTWLNSQHTEYAHFADELTMPRLNYANPDVRNYMTAVAVHWLDPNGDGNLDDGADGFRCDVAGGPPHIFWQQVRAAVNAVNPQTVLLGEFWIDRDHIQDYLNSGEFDAAFDFPSYMALTALHETDKDGPFFGAEPISNVMDVMRNEKTLYAPGSHMVRFLNNHDTNRIMSDVGDDMHRTRAAAVWLATVPGTIQIYQGEEIGMKGSKTDQKPFWDENERSPLLWYGTQQGPGQTTWFQSAVNHPGDGTSIEDEDWQPDSLLTVYRQMLALRNREPALLHGDYDLPPQPNDLYVIRRWSGNRMFTIAINFSNDFITWTPPPAMLEKGVRILNMGGFDPVNGQIKMNPRGAYAIYESPLY